MSNPTDWGGYTFGGGNATATIAGKLDDVAVFNRVLTDLEISNLYYTNIKKIAGVNNIRIVSATGGTITQDGDYAVHTFTSSGTFTFIPAPTISGFTPTSGGSGASVVITGTNLTEC